MTSGSVTALDLISNEADVFLRNWRKKILKKENKKQRTKNIGPNVAAKKIKMCCFMVTCSILFELKRATLVLDTDNSVAAQAGKHFQLQAKQGQRKVFRVPPCERSAEHGVSACASSKNKAGLQRKSDDPI